MKRPLMFLIAVLFSAVMALAGDLKFTWEYDDAVGDGVTGYRLRWGAVAGGPYTVSKDFVGPLVPTAASPALVTGIKPGTYFFAVSALLGPLEGELSNEVSAQVFLKKPTALTKIP